MMNEWAKPTTQGAPGLPYAAYLWLHDAAYNAPPAAYARATKVLVLSDHHKRCLAKHDGYTGPTTLVANGVIATQFPELTPAVEMERDPHKVIYASSPDRGLAELLTLWPAVRKAVPDATLDIYYDWTLFRKLKPEDCAVMEKLLADVMTECSDASGSTDGGGVADGGGITYHGGVDQPTLHAAFRRASIWAYPHYDSEIETFCISGIKALASGCMPVTANTGALPEVLLNHGVRVPRNEFQAVLIGALLSTVSPSARAAMRESALSRYDWKVVAAMFLKAMS
jgi:glycosyltransferase involved in cell wall biosynthesis